MTAAVELPPLVRSYIQRALVSQSSSPRRVRIGQAGEMTLKPGTKPRRFTATEEFAVDRLAFSWRARFPIGPLALHVIDSYDGADGLLEVRLLGVPLQRRRGPELARGEVFRYLAELAWVPHAVAANRRLTWREVGERAVEVSTEVDGQWVAVRLQFNEQGDISQTSARRPRAEAGNELTPWVGVFDDHRELGGVRLPAYGEVCWELEDRPFTYWRGRILSVELLD